MPPANRQQRRTTATRPPVKAAAVKQAPPAKASKRAPVVEEPEDDFDATEEEDDDEVGDDGLPDVFDLSEVPDAPEYKPVKPGWYDGVIDEVRYEASKSSGNPMLTWIVKAETDDGERTFYYHTTLAGNGLSRTKRTIARLDPEYDLSDLRPREANDDFAELEVRIKVGIEPSRDNPKEKRNTVKDLAAIDEDELS